VTEDALDGDGSESVIPSGATSDEGDNTVGMEGMGAAAETEATVEAVGQVPEGSFLAKAFFSLARLF
jgi:hypothetical protein